MSLETLTEISRYYGADPAYVIAGGGNTSWKDGGALYVKASGTSLGTIKPEEFVKMDRAALAAVWTKRYPEDASTREAAVLADLMASRARGEEGKRPSVETLVHDALPFRYVVHTHPALVNGVTCSREGEEAARRLFAGQAEAPPLWIPVVNPGYVLSAAVQAAQDAYRAEHGRPAEVVLLQNHGVFAGADSAQGIRRIYERIMQVVGGAVERRPDFSDGADRARPPDRLVRALTDALSAYYPGGLSLRFDRNNEIARLVQSRASFAAVAGAYTPDHIVYAGSDPLFIEGAVCIAADGGAVREAVAAHTAKTGRPPKIIAAEGAGVFSAGAHEKASSLAYALFQDSAAIAAYTESFGGPCFMPADKVDFINNWEVERYRSSVSVQ